MKHNINDCRTDEVRRKDLLLKEKYNYDERTGCYNIGRVSTEENNIEFKIDESYTELQMNVRADYGCWEAKLCLDENSLDDIIKSLELGRKALSEVETFYENINQEDWC